MVLTQLDSDVDEQLRELLRALPVRSLVVLHATWQYPTVALNLLRELATQHRQHLLHQKRRMEAAMAAVCVGLEPEHAAVTAAAWLRTEAAARAAASVPFAGLRKLQMWSRDKEAFDISCRVLAVSGTGRQVRQALTHQGENGVW